MDRATKRRKTETDGSGSPRSSEEFSSGDGDADHELREEVEDEWFHCTTRYHLPHLSDCSPYSDSESEVIMDYGWPYDGDIDQLPEYEIGIEDYYEEDLLLSTFEQSQDMEDYNRDMDLLRERETAEWPEDMRRQYDEGWSHCEPAPYNPKSRQTFPARLGT